MLRDMAMPAAGHCRCWPAGRYAIDAAIVIRHSHCQPFTPLIDILFDAIATMHYYYHDYCQRIRGAAGIRHLLIRQPP